MRGPRARTGELVTAGGRVLNVTALGADAATARERAYDAAELITFDGRADPHRHRRPCRRANRAQEA